MARAPLCRLRLNNSYIRYSIFSNTIITIILNITFIIPITYTIYITIFLSSILTIIEPKVVGIYISNWFGITYRRGSIVVQWLRKRPFFTYITNLFAWQPTWQFFQKRMNLSHTQKNGLF